MKDKLLYLDMWFYHDLMKNKFNYSKEILVEALNNKNYTLVLSEILIGEMSNYLNVEHVKSIGYFLENIRHKKWICSYERVREIELRNAYSEFKRYSTKRSVFSENIRDILEYSPESALALFSSKISLIELLLFYQKNINIQKEITQKHQNIIDSYWWNANKEINRSLNLTQKWQKKVKVKLENIIVQIVIHHKICEIEELDEFLDFVKTHLNLIPSTWLTFYIQHFKMRNINQPLNMNDVNDIAHTIAIPYVNFICLDSNFYDKVNSVINFSTPCVNLKRYLEHLYKHETINSLFENLIKENPT